MTRCFGTEYPGSGQNGCYLALGAQGPDIFYHNQRTMPTAIHYGVTLHRQGYGRFCARMVEQARGAGWQLASEAGAFIAGYVTHAILDRYTHPFVNYFSGWVDPNDESTIRFRSMHPFFERIIDVHVLARFRNMDVNAYNFHGRVFCGNTAPESVIRLQAHGLKEAYRRARSDTSLETRLHNAYGDAMGYYRYSNLITPQRLREGLRREKAGEMGARWLAILHPFSLPDGIDFLNEGHAVWRQPCDGSGELRASFWDLFDAAMDRCVVAVDALRKAWQGEIDTSGEGETLEAAVGNGGLSDTSGNGSPCRKVHSSPLPLYELMESLRGKIHRGEVPQVPQRP